MHVTYRMPTLTEMQRAAHARIKGQSMNPRIQGRNKKAQQVAHRVKMMLMNTWA